MQYMHRYSSTRFGINYLWLDPVLVRCSAMEGRSSTEILPCTSASQLVPDFRHSHGGWDIISSLRVDSYGGGHLFSSSAKCCMEHTCAHC